MVPNITIKKMYSGTCLMRQPKGPRKCVGLYRMSEYWGFILVNGNTFGLYISVGCHRMSENSCFELHKFHCNTYKMEIIYIRVIEIINEKRLLKVVPYTSGQILPYSFLKKKRQIYFGKNLVLRWYHTLQVKFYLLV